MDVVDGIYGVVGYVVVFGQGGVVLCEVCDQVVGCMQ